MLCQESFFVSILVLFYASCTFSWANFVTDLCDEKYGHCPTFRFLHNWNCHSVGPTHENSVILSYMWRPFVLWYNYNPQDLRTHARQFPLHWDALGLHIARGVFGKEHLAKTKIHEEMSEKKKTHCAWKRGLHPVIKVLKNAARATIESNPNLRGSSLPPVSIVLASNSQVMWMKTMIKVMMILMMIMKIRVILASWFHCSCFKFSGEECAGDVDNGPFLRSFMDVIVICR